MAEKSKGLIGVLTGGGDCPGLNAVIRGIVRQAGTAVLPHGSVQTCKPQHVRVTRRNFPISLTHLGHFC